MCDWHLADGTSEKNYAPFLFGAFPLLPIEVRLWNQRRIEHGRAPAESGHPLLHTGLERLALRPVDPFPEGHTLLRVAAEPILADGLVSREWLCETREEFQRAQG